jgi:heme ABC exporter ATP-binding subunit CcmA
MDRALHFRSAVAMVGRFPVLAGVDLDVSRGEIVLLRGANGAGKTSLLRACAGLVRVVSGEAVVLGEDIVADRKAVRRRVGLLGHAGSLYEDLSPYDNVKFFLRVSGTPASRGGPALDTMGLTGRLRDTPVAALSAGQRRRAALAVLLARDPELWLLDEPHAGLDADHRDLLDGLVRDAVSRGATVLLSSHEAGRSDALADRTVMLAGGTTVEPAQPPAAEPGDAHARGQTAGRGVAHVA